MHTSLLSRDGWIGCDKESLTELHLCSSYNNPHHQAYTYTCTCTYTYTCTCTHTHTLHIDNNCIKNSAKEDKTDTYIMQDYQCVCVCVLECRNSISKVTIISCYKMIPTSFGQPISSLMTIVMGCNLPHNLCTIILVHSNMTLVFLFKHMQC